MKYFDAAQELKHPMNLQLFAEPPAEPTEPTEPQEPTEPTEPKEPDEPKLFTQEDVDKIINKRFAVIQAKHEKMIEEARTEGEKLAKMNAEERAKAEQEKREKALTEREMKVARAELKTSANEELKKRGFDYPELADILNLTDAETCQSHIEIIDKVLRAALEKLVNDRLKGTPPKTGSTVPPQPETLTRDNVSDSIAKKSAMLYEPKK